MITREIESLKQKLDTMIESEDFPYSEILKVSRELDVLIVRYFKESKDSHKDIQFKEYRKGAV